MKWCAYCRKYVQTCVEKTEIRVVEWMRLVYHCSECNGFIESRELTPARNIKPIGKQRKISVRVNKRPQKTKNLKKK